MRRCKSFAIVYYRKYFWRCVKKIYVQLQFTIVDNNRIYFNYLLKEVSIKRTIYILVDYSPLGTPQYFFVSKKFSYKLTLA